MSKFLALIMAAAMALFIAGPAMAQDNGGLTVTKTVTNSNDADTTFSTDIDVNKDVDISVSGNLDATGGVNVSGDSIFKELDVNVQDQEAVVKFFELDDSAKSSWVISGLNGLNAMEQLQNGEFNLATINQLATPVPGFSENVMNVGLQYQVGFNNVALTQQRGAPVVDLESGTNNFAKQIQIGDANGATIRQNQ